VVRAVIIQRVVPHYRVPLFEELHRRLGWRVVCAQDAPGAGLSLARPADHPWLEALPFHLSSRNPHRGHVPLGPILEQLRPEALVCEFATQLTLVWWLALFGSPVPFAFWSQGWSRSRGFSSLPDRLVQALRLGLMRRADAQLAYSEESASFLTDRLGSAKPVFVARNTLEINHLPGRGVDTSPRDPSAPHLVCLGRLTADKHVPRVIEAFGRIRDSFPGARLTVIGDGPDRPTVQRLAAESSGSVAWRGEIYDDGEIGEVLQGASLMVIGGSAGLSVNHALAHGVPVMLFDDPVAHHHHPEHAYVIDGKTGFRVKGKSVEALAQAMRAALAAPGPRALLGKACADYADTELSLDRMVEGFERLDAHFKTLI
jgi:glycosyltransferase involved in cell wall biosynthesis